MSLSSEEKVSIGLIVVAVVGYCGLGLWKLGAESTGLLLSVLLLSLVKQTVCGFLGALIAQYLFQLPLSDGSVPGMLLKIAAIVVFPSVIYLLLPGWMALLGVFPLTMLLVGYLFELDAGDLLWSTVILVVSARLGGML